MKNRGWGSGSSKKERLKTKIDTNYVLNRLWEKYWNAEIQLSGPQIVSSSKVLADYSSRFGDKE